MCEGEIRIERGEGEREREREGGGRERGRGKEGMGAGCQGRRFQSKVQSDNDLYLYNHI